MGTTIAVPAAILPLPFAFSQLGWAPAIIALVLGTATTYYASMLLASLFSWNGEKYYRYRDLVKSIFGESLILHVFAAARLRMLGTLNMINNKVCSVAGHEGHDCSSLICRPKH